MDSRAGCPCATFDCFAWALRLFYHLVAFCARLAENVGIVKHAIVKLRHAGYVEE